MSLNKYLRVSVYAGALALAFSARAAAPVEDIGSGSMPSASYSEEATTYPAGDTNTQGNFANPVPSNLSDSQRLARVEQQVNNLISMNLPQQLSDLQEQMQQLNGQLQEMQHQVKTLSDQQTSFYQDLDQRLNHLKAGSSAGGSATSAPPTPMSSGTKLKENDEYQAAVNLLMKKDYAKAGTAFKNYLALYPQGSYLANAYYWLGEVNLMNKNLSQAATNFQKVISKYPKSDKIADARLKLALVHAQQGNTQMAKAELKKIKADYPGSTIAQLATIQLQQLDNSSLNTN